jgi:nucleotide-binding universal stress UspA family protein
MKRWRNILVPVDFSSTSAAALRAAARIAKKSGGSVHLLHVFPFPHGAMESLHTFNAIQREAGRSADRPRGQLAVWTERCRKACGRATKHVAMGRPADEIAAVAAQLKADLIVMGSRGLGGLRGALLGSTAAETLRAASVPVLTVRGGRGAGLEPARGLVADDLDAGGEAAIAGAAALLDPKKTRVLLLHAIDPGTQFYTGVPEWGWPVPPATIADEKAIARKLHRRSAALRRRGFRVECLVVRGDPASEISRVAENWKAAAIIMASHRRHAIERLVLGSAAETTVRKAHCPVFVVKAIPPAVRDEEAPTRPLALTRGKRSGGSAREMLALALTPPAD